MKVSKCCNQKAKYGVDKKNFGICSWCKKPSKFYKQGEKNEEN